MKNWHSLDELDELLGSELNLDQAWSEFKKDKKKTRRIPIWWYFGFGSIFFLGLVLYFGNSNNLKIDDKEIAANMLHDNAVIPCFENTPLSLEREKVTSQKEITSSTTVALNKEHYSKYKKRNTIQQVIEPSLDQIALLERHFFLEEKDNSPAIISIKEKTITNPIVDENISNNALVEVAKIPALQSYLFPQRLDNISIPSEKHLPVLGKKWRGGINYTLARANRKLTGGQEAYIQRRQEEDFLRMERIDFFVTRDLSNYFFFQTGLALTQYRSKIVDDIQTIISPVLYENVITETQTRDDFTQEIIGTTEGSQLTINRFIRFQRYQTISIPLRLGIRIPLSPHWQLTANSGVAISVFSKAKGFTFSSALPNGEYIPLAQLEYRKVGLLEGLSGVGVERVFGNTTLNFGIQGTIDLNNRFNNKTSGVDKFSSYGIQIGLQRSF